jgi:glycerate-2-kinase
MAAAFSRLPGIAVHRLLVAAPRPDSTIRLDGAESWEAGHPLPNDASRQAALRALAIAREGAAAGRELIVLLSGGASAMLAAPAAPLHLRHKAETARALMRAGVAIDGLNCVRKHLSDIKGGRLGAAARASHTLAISDVHSPMPDDPAVIGSGPTVADPTTYAQAFEIAAGVKGVPQEVVEHLRRGAAGERPESIKPGDPRLNHAQFEIVGSRAIALAAASRCAEGLGYDVRVESAPTSGEAREAGQAFLARARKAAASGARPLCVLAAGETTVTVSGDGIGGRNQEFALAAAPGLGALGRASLLASAGTDGIDGPTDAAGGLVDSSTLDRALRLGLDLSSSLERNDAYHFFAPLGDLIAWGPTGTNVGDVHVLLVA